jgi:hypothetical protein
LKQTKVVVGCLHLFGLMTFENSSSDSCFPSMELRHMMAGYLSVHASETPELSTAANKIVQISSNKSSEKQLPMRHSEFY